jgi:uncharacterized protein (TIGR02145 family)
MKFFSTILFLFVFEFANAQVAGMPFVMNPLVRKFSLNVTTSSSTTANFELKFASNLSNTILECGVIYSYNNNATISNNQGKWVAATNFKGGIELSTGITHSFVYAPYFAIPYCTVSNGTYYGTAVKFTPNWATVTINGKVWAAANLGASVIATAASTNSNMFGFYYQWGRGSDGHQLSSSTTTSTIATSSIPGNSNFITNISGVYYFDWMTVQNLTLWQGVDGQNNPCPSGYRLPSSTELKSAYSTLQIPNNGYRRAQDGALVATNWGYLWTTDLRTNSKNGYSYWRADEYEKDNSVVGSDNANAFPIRCIQN